MHLKVICQSLQIRRNMILKTSKKHEFLKILLFSSKGSSEKKDGGECFAPCQWERVRFDFARQRGEKLILNAHQA